MERRRENRCAPWRNKHRLLLCQSSFNAVESVFRHGRLSDIRVEPRALGSEIRRDHSAFQITHEILQRQPGCSLKKRTGKIRQAQRVAFCSALFGFPPLVFRLHKSRIHRPVENLNRPNAYSHRHGRCRSRYRKGPRIIPSNDVPEQSHILYNLRSYPQPVCQQKPDFKPFRGK